MTDENIFLLHAFGLGIFITFVYDLLRIFRRTIPHKDVVVAAEDLGFWGFCAIEVFLLMYHESNGNLRWFAVFGALAGMFLYHKTLSRPFVNMVSLLLQKLLGFLTRAAGVLWKPAEAAGRGIRRVGRKIGGKRKRFWTFCKKRLTAALKLLKIVVHKS